MHDQFRELLDPATTCDQEVNVGLVLTRQHKTALAEMLLGTLGPPFMAPLLWEIIERAAPLFLEQNQRRWARAMRANLNEIRAQLRFPKLNSRSMQR
jgi:hypothetical protein